MKAYLVKGIVALALVGSVTFTGVQYVGNQKVLSVQGKVDTMVSKITTLNQDITTLDGIIKEKNTLLLKFNSEKKVDTAKITELQAQITSLEQEKATLVSQLSEAQEQVTSLQKQIESSNTNIEQAQTEITRLEGEVTKANNELTSLETYVNGKYETVANIGTTNVDTGIYEVELDSLVTDPSESINVNDYLESTFSTSGSTTMNKDQETWAKVCKLIRENVSGAESLKLLSVEFSSTTYYDITISKSLASNPTLVENITEYLNTNPQAIKDLLKTSSCANPTFGGTVQ